MTPREMEAKRALMNVQALESKLERVAGRIIRDLQQAREKLHSLEQIGFYVEADNGIGFVSFQDEDLTTAWGKAIEHVGEDNRLVKPLYRGEYLEMKRKVGVD